VSILDLQGMQSAATQALAAKSSTSKNCGNVISVPGGRNSNLSLLCDVL
jgi:hypothetical protein